MTPTPTQKFEVTVDGVVVHSKLHGDGFVDTEEKTVKINKAIEAALAK